MAGPLPLLVILGILTLIGLYPQEATALAWFFGALIIWRATERY